MYEYIQGGKPMAALIYYLEADSRTIFSLLFRRPRDEIQRLLNQADSIASSFRLKTSSRIPKLTMQVDSGGKPLFLTCSILRIANPGQFTK